MKIDDSYWLELSILERQFEFPFWIFYFKQYEYSIDNIFKNRSVSYSFKRRHIDQLNSATDQRMVAGCNINVMLS